MFQDLKDLKVADFRMNLLTSLDEHILGNESLTVLDASHNHISQERFSLCAMPRSFK